ncbi:hypothetical protein AHiyo8_02720 [Arthrobacter sp. Hiyo8]|nr:hypothetical protein AHiyo8_02720 [Arthrobacter sp. Hiyo8]
MQKLCYVFGVVFFHGRNDDQAHAPLAVGRDEHLIGNSLGIHCAAWRMHGDTLPDILPDGLDPDFITFVQPQLFPVSMKSPAFDFKQIGKVGIHREPHFTASRLTEIVVDCDVLDDARPNHPFPFDGHRTICTADVTRCPPEVGSLKWRRCPGA